LIELLAREGVNTIDWCVDNLSIIYTLWYKKSTYRYTVSSRSTLHTCDVNMQWVKQSTQHQQRATFYRRVRVTG